MLYRMCPVALTYIIMWKLSDENVPVECAPLLTYTIISVLALSICGETAHFETLAAMGMLTRRERCGQ